MLPGNKYFKTSSIPTKYNPSVLKVPRALPSIFPVEFFVKFSVEVTQFLSLLQSGNQRSSNLWKVQIDIKDSKINEKNHQVKNI